MAERYLTGGIQRAGQDAKLAAVSARLLQIGCGIPIEPPAGRRRLSVIEKPFPLKLGSERNGELAIAVAAERKYHWVMPGLETVMNLADDLLGNVTIVRHMENVAPCEYRPGVSALAYGVETLEELEELIKQGLRIPQTLEELKPGTRIATKHVNLMERIIRERNLDLQAIYDPTPETAPELRRIYWAADNFEKGTTWAKHNIMPINEVLLKPHAVLLKVKRLPSGIGPLFYDEFLPRFDRALEHPERWLNPDARIPKDDGMVDAHNSQHSQPERRFWDLGGLLSRTGKVAVGSTLLFTLLNTSVILNPPWRSRTSEEKDLRS